ncbi:ccr4-not transcription complex [Anaeramoeba flamelloides]|uniref:Ccr4-not transcription complex n=1 Tax=Anaeramoeba flamelloides TaxID=1746091 RepID=A0ABQ8YY83_9EUKA|nr:ccr4-not transcription complex [Anaeramoeba flamelloides]
MLSNFSLLLGTQIDFLLSTLNKQNYRENTNEINELIEIYGPDVFMYLLKKLFSSLNFTLGTQNFSQQEKLLQQLLKQELTFIADRPNFVSVICIAFENIQQIPNNYLSLVSQALVLSKTQEIIIAIGLAESKNEKLKKIGLEYLRKDTDETIDEGFLFLPENALHTLYCLFKEHNLQLQKNNILQIIKKRFPEQNDLPPTLIPILQDNMWFSNSSREFEREMGLVNEGSSWINSEFNKSCHLSTILSDLGYEALSNEETFQQLLTKVSPLTEEDLARTITNMANKSGTDFENQKQNLGYLTNNVEILNSQQNLIKWDIDLFLNVINKYYSNSISWIKIIRSLDYEGFRLNNFFSFYVLYMFIKKATNQSFPLNFVLSRWANSKAQISFLKQAMKSPSYIIDFSASKRKQTLIEALGHGTSVITDQNKKIENLNQTWISLDLVELLLGLANTSIDLVREIFSEHFQNSPEYLLLGLVQLNENWNSLAKELFEHLLQLFLRNHPNADFIFHNMFALRPQMIIDGIINLWVKKIITLSDLLNLVQHHKVLLKVLDSNNFNFIFHLASLASHLESLNLEKWLNELINSKGELFIVHCIQFLEMTLKEKNSQISLNFNLTEDILAIYFKCLFENSYKIINKSTNENEYENGNENNSNSNNNNNVKNNNRNKNENKNKNRNRKKNEDGNGNDNKNYLIEKLNIFYKYCLQIYPNLTNYYVKNEELTFTKDVEEIANNHFKRIYQKRISIEEAIQLLVSLKKSNNTKSNQIFDCMIYNILDEYQFFPKFPFVVLEITAYLLGILIRENLIQHIPLGIALRNILDALKKSPDSNLFKFGILALSQFYNRLNEWHQYCIHIIQIPHLEKTQPYLYQNVNQIINKQTKKELGNSLNNELLENNNFNNNNNESPFLQFGEKNNSKSISNQDIFLNNNSGSIDNDNNNNNEEFLLKQFLYNENKNQSNGNNLNLNNNLPNNNNNINNNNNNEPIYPIENMFFNQNNNNDLYPTSPPNQQIKIMGNINNEQNQNNFNDLNNNFLTNLDGNNNNNNNFFTNLEDGNNNNSNILLTNLEDDDDDDDDNNNNFLTNIDGNNSNNNAFTLENNQDLIKNILLNNNLNEQELDEQSLEDEEDDEENEEKKNLGGINLSGLNIKTLVKGTQIDENIEIPDEETENQILFLINNLSIENIDDKVNKLKKLFENKYEKWLARYLVLKRISIESNFHGLYLELLNKLNLKKLNNFILNFTYQNINNILNSKKLKNNSNEKLLLKNLGSWLGKTTLALDKPVLRKYLPIRKIIIQSYQAGQLDVMITFVSNILNSAVESKYFKPPNPWLMSILKLYIEIVQLPNLKMNIQFAINGLLENLEIDVNEIRLDNIFSKLNAVNMKNENYQFLKNFKHNKFNKNLNMRNEKQSEEQILLQQEQEQLMLLRRQRQDQDGVVEHERVHVHDLEHEHMNEQKQKQLELQLQQLQLQQQQQQQQRFKEQNNHLFKEGNNNNNNNNNQEQNDENNNLFISGFTDNINLRFNNPIYQLFPDLKQNIPIAVTLSIQSIILPVVQRSVTIACQTTIELIRKDFGLEPDHEKMRKAAHLMVSNLASGLALVTAKEPLKVSMAEALTKLLQDITPNIDLINETILNVCNDNLQLAFQFIKKATIEQSIQQIDEYLMRDYEVRIKSTQYNQTYVDTTIFNQSNIPSQLPSELIPRSPGLNDYHYSIYEKYAKISHLFNSNVKDQNENDILNQNEKGQNEIPQKENVNVNGNENENEKESVNNNNNIDDQEDHISLSINDFLEILEQWSSKLNEEFQRINDELNKLGALSQENNLSNIIPFLPKAINQCSQKDQAILYSTQLILKSIIHLKQIILDIGNIPTISNDNENGNSNNNKNNNNNNTSNNQDNTNDNDQIDEQQKINLIYMYEIFINVYIKVLSLINENCDVDMATPITQFLISIDENSNSFDISLVFLLFNEGLIKPIYLGHPLSQMIKTNQDPKAFEFGIIILHHLVLNQDIESLLKLDKVYLEIEQLLINRQNQIQNNLNNNINFEKDEFLDEKLPELINQIKELKSNFDLKGNQLKLNENGKVDESEIEKNVNLEKNQENLLMNQNQNEQKQNANENENNQENENDQENFIETHEKLFSEFILLFDQWINLIQKPDSSNRKEEFLILLNHLKEVVIQHGYKFFLVITEVCINNFFKRSFDQEKQQNDEKKEIDGKKLENKNEINNKNGNENNLANKNNENENAEGENNKKKNDEVDNDDDDDDDENFDFGVIDTYCQMISMLIKMFPSSEQGLNEIEIVRSILTSVFRFIDIEMRENPESFNYHPYNRILTQLLFELSNGEFSEEIFLDILTIYGQCYLALKPQIYPLFSFAWVELITNKHFFPKLISVNNNNNNNNTNNNNINNNNQNENENENNNIGEEIYHELLISLFQFLYPYLKNNIVTKPIKKLYKGALRILLVLLHDFPQFLCDYYFTLCNSIPICCIQMRNLILSAFPPNMKLIDPFTPDLKIDLLDDIKYSPKIKSNYLTILEHNNFKKKIDKYLITSSPTNFLPLLKKRFYSKEYIEFKKQKRNNNNNNNDEDLTFDPKYEKYDIPLINSFVLYLCVKAIEPQQNNEIYQSIENQTEKNDQKKDNKSKNSSGILSNIDVNEEQQKIIYQNSIQILIYLANNWYCQPKYLFINSIVNQLRYPNSHTHFFSFIILYLFSETQSDELKELIIRVLLEKLIVHRPHPWGCLTIFLELFRNKKYNVHADRFAEKSQDISHLFRLVKNSTMGLDNQLEPNENQKN